MEIYYIFIKALERQKRHFGNMSQDIEELHITQKKEKFIFQKGKQFILKQWMSAKVII